MVAPGFRRLRTPLLVAGAVSCALACLVAVAAWWYGPWREKYVVPLPPAAASPRQVVLAYVRALDAHDSATALALSAPAFRGTTQGWLASTASITQVNVGAVQYDAQQPPGEQYSVAVNFDYHSHWWKDDPSFGDGEHYWGYSLEKIGGRWLITDDGAV
jgi:hypothetical protein